MGRHAAPHTPQLTSHAKPNPTYEKAPRRTTTFPAINATNLEAPQHNTHRTRNKVTSTRVTPPTTKTPPKTTNPAHTKLPSTKPNQQEKPPQTSTRPTKTNITKSSKTPPEILNTFNDPALLAALTLLVVGIILTGLSWGWLYAGAIAFVTLGFTAAYTVLYAKNNTPPPSE